MLKKITVVLVRPSVRLSRIDPDPCVARLRQCLQASDRFLRREASGCRRAESRREQSGLGSSNLCRRDGSAKARWAGSDTAPRSRVERSEPLLPRAATQGRLTRERFQPSLWSPADQTVATRIDFGTDPEIWPRERRSVRADITMEDDRTKARPPKGRETLKTNRSSSVTGLQCGNDRCNLKNARFLWSSLPHGSLTRCPIPPTRRAH